MVLASVPGEGWGGGGQGCPPPVSGGTSEVGDRRCRRCMCFGQEHGLDFERLLDASTYKEAYRRDMIRWGEEKRQADPGFFCRKVVEGVSQPVWVSVLRAAFRLFRL